MHVKELLEIKRNTCSCNATNYKKLGMQIKILFLEKQKSF